jgi:hypothetical protein
VRPPESPPHQACCNHRGNREPCSAQTDPRTTTSGAFRRTRPQPIEYPAWLTHGSTNQGLAPAGFERHCVTSDGVTAVTATARRLASAAAAALTNPPSPLLKGRRVGIRRHSRHSRHAVTPSRHSRLINVAFDQSKPKGFPRTSRTMFLRPGRTEGIRHFPVRPQASASHIRAGRILLRNPAATASLGLRRSAPESVDP